MSILVGDWVEPNIEHVVDVEVYPFPMTVPYSYRDSIKLEKIFKVVGIFRRMGSAEIVPLDQTLPSYKGDHLYYTVDLRLLRKIEGSRLEMLQTLYNDSEEVSSRRNS